MFCDSEKTAKVIIPYTHVISWYISKWQFKPYKYTAEVTIFKTQMKTWPELFSEAARVWRNLSIESFNEFSTLLSDRFPALSYVARIWEEMVESVIEAKWMLLHPHIVTNTQYYNLWMLKYIRQYKNIFQINQHGVRHIYIYIYIYIYIRLIIFYIEQTVM